MADDSFYFDTYALVEVSKSNPSYRNYLKSRVFTSKINIFEFFYTLSRDSGERVAFHQAKNYYKFVKDFGFAVLIQAARLKAQMKKENLSLVDCIGYFIAKSLGIKFLTGDEKFRDMPNVEFVK